MKFLAVLVFVSVVISTIVGQKVGVYQVASLTQANVEVEVAGK